MFSLLWQFNTPFYRLELENYPILHRLQLDKDEGHTFDGVIGRCYGVQQYKWLSTQNYNSRVAGIFVR